MHDILLSALQHYVVCPRQCALIHMEQIWTENEHTAAGRLLHEWFASCCFRLTGQSDRKSVV